MARKKSIEAEVCEAAIDALRDVIRDIEVIAKGRGSHARFWAVQDTLWKVERMVGDIDPDNIRRKAEKASEPKPVALIGQQTLFALEDKS